MTWWGKWAAIKTLERQTHTWTPQNSVHRRAFRYLLKYKFTQLRFIDFQQLEIT